MKSDMKIKVFKISKEVQAALNARKPMVALESTIISHGMPYPDNVRTALDSERSIRQRGAVPATIAIMEGIIKVGLSEDEIKKIGCGKNIIKCSLRDIPSVLFKKLNGSTTVASTTFVANAVGINVFSTGGMGGVHRGAQESFDISADLHQIAKTNIALVCSGVKSILDIKLTLEYLETLGVPIIGYQTKSLPEFYFSSSKFDVDIRLNSVDEIVSYLQLKWEAALKGGVIIANPIPDEYSLNRKVIENITEKLILEVENKKLSGKLVTPFLLKEIIKATQGKSLESHRQLVINNAKLGAEIAVAFAKVNG